MTITLTQANDIARNYATAHSALRDSLVSLWPTDEMLEHEPFELASVGTSVSDHDDPRFFYVAVTIEPGGVVRESRVPQFKSHDPAFRELRIDRDIDSAIRHFGITFLVCNLWCAYATWIEHVTRAGLVPPEHARESERALDEITQGLKRYGARRNGPRQ